LLNGYNTQSFLSNVYHEAVIRERVLADYTARTNWNFEFA